jgi:hypothetical protein
MSDQFTPIMDSLRQAMPNSQSLASQLARDEQHVAKIGKTGRQHEIEPSGRVAPLA